MEPGIVKRASGRVANPDDTRAARERKGGVAYMARRGAIPGDVHLVPARAVQVGYGDGKIIRTYGGDAEVAVRTPFGPVSVEED